MTKRACPNCSTPVTGHPNKKFCGPRCKDRYHNHHNPRGLFSRPPQEPVETVNGMIPPPGYSGMTDQEHDHCMDAQEASESPGGCWS